MRKKILIGLISGVALVAMTVALSFCIFQSATALPKLPKPEVSEGMRGELGIDKNINESTIDDYLGRPDAVYRDLRMLKDPGNYESIDGDSYISGIVKGFEVVPFPYIIAPEGLPLSVGQSWTGETLFRRENGRPVANYEESLDVLETLFPKDKVIFLMCGGGGYSGMMKQLLADLGWDADKIYDVGGYWYYNGKNKVEIRTEKYGDVSYDFWKLAYHDIDFSKLHKKEAAGDGED